MLTLPNSFICNQNNYKHQAAWIYIPIDTQVWNLEMIEMCKICQSGQILVVLESSYEGVDSN